MRKGINIQAALSYANGGGTRKLNCGVTGKKQMLHMLPGR